MARIPKPSGRKERKEVLISYGRHLIYAEGKKTEPLYVENIANIVRKKHNFNNTRIAIENVEHEGHNTLGLVEFAYQDVEKRLLNKEKIEHVWILLHFEYLNTPLRRDSYIPKINEVYLKKDLYTKNRVDLYELSDRNGSVKQAINNAKKLYEENGISNPSTGIYQFVDFFYKYLSK